MTTFGVPVLLNATLRDGSLREAAAETGVEGLRERLLPPDAALEGMPKLAVGPEASQRFLQGQPVGCPDTGLEGLVSGYGGEG